MSTTWADALYAWSISQSVLSVGLFTFFGKAVHRNALVIFGPMALILRRVAGDSLKAVVRRIIEYLRARVTIGSAAAGSLISMTACWVDGDISSKTSASEGTGWPMYSGAFHEPASSDWATARVILEISPVPLVVRSTVASCIKTTRASAVVRTSNSQASAPTAIEAATEARVFSGARCEKPRWDITLQFEAAAVAAWQQPLNWN